MPLLSNQAERRACVVYSPESPLRSPAEFVRRFVDDVWASRGLAWRLLIRNLSAQYRQTLLGYLWVFLPVLATTATWVFLHSSNVVQFDTPGVVYPVFVLTGLALWQTFVDALQAPLRIVTDSKPMLAKINFPREALLLVAASEVIFNSLIRLILLAGVLAWFGVVPPASALLLPVGLLSLTAFGLMLGLLMVPLGLLYQDFSRGIVLIAQFWMYLTPVVYPPPETWPASLLNTLNPVSPLILVTRDWMLTGTTGQLPAFCLVVAATFLFTMVGLAMFRLAMPILIERMSA